MKTKQDLVDAVIEDMKNGFKYGDYTVLDELLMNYCPARHLVHCIGDESKWAEYVEQQHEPTKDCTIVEIDTLMMSCNEGLTGEWNTSTDEGKEGFEAMIESLERIRTYVA